MSNRSAAIRHGRIAAMLLACAAAGALASIGIAKSSGRAAAAAYYYYCPGGSAGSNYGYCPPTTTTTTTTPPPPPPVPAQHYVAYDRQEPEQFFENVTVVDQYGTHRLGVEEIEFLLTPAEKRRAGRPAEPILRPDAHLACHGINPPQSFPQRTAVVTNQFGTRTLTLGRPVWLCAPASKTLTGTPGAPPAPANHYLCYDVRSESPSFRSETLTTIDQFGTLSARVDRTREFCNPAEKRRDGRPAEPIVRPADHLACIRISSFTPAFAARNTFVRDQFSLETVRIDTPRRLCTPSTKQ